MPNDRLPEQGQHTTPSTEELLDSAIAAVRTIEKGIGASVLATSDAITRIQAETIRDAVALADEALWDAVEILDAVATAGVRARNPASDIP